VAVFFIFLYDWLRGCEIETAKSFAILAMIFYIFVMVNMLWYYALTIMWQFIAVL
jgi:hypothetical protein